MNASAQVRCYTVLLQKGLASAASSSNGPRILMSTLQPPSNLSTPQRRWNSSESDDSNVIYQSPMGGLITRLKIVSITSCVTSVVGLPIFIAIKNGDFPTAKQMALGGVAFLGATGSTVALHFVFGPYILALEKIAVRKCHYKGTEGEEDGEEKKECKSSEEELAKPKPSMMKATTRSVFGWKNELVFDPATDVTQYEGFRPFANFVAKGVTLYAHPHLLADEVREQLIWSKPVEEPKSEKEQDDDRII